MIQQSHSSACIWKRQSKICKDTHTPMFTAALFTTFKMWKQPKYPSIDEIRCGGMCVCVCVCVYTHTCTHSGILLCNKKDEILKICHLQQHGWIYR